MSATTLSAAAIQPNGVDDTIDAYIVTWPSLMLTATAVCGTVETVDWLDAARPG
jgi:hypothetical protein